MGSPPTNFPYTEYARDDYVYCMTNKYQHNTFLSAFFATAFKLIKKKLNAHKNVIAKTTPTSFAWIAEVQNKVMERKLKQLEWKLFFCETTLRISWSWEWRFAHHLCIFHHVNALFSSARVYSWLVWQISTTPCLYKVPSRFTFCALHSSSICQLWSTYIFFEGTTDYQLEHFV